MKKLITLFFIVVVIQVKGHEGMWIPMLLNMDDMQANGLKLSAEDIYSINHSSLKDAIVHFGGGCTSEIISDQGLLLTNYHCGYSRIQAHSSLEHDYLTDGFWAMSKDEELVNKGLTATLIIQIVDVTDRVLDSIDDTTSEEVRAGIVKANSLELVDEYTKDTHYKAKVVAFDYGNSYFIIVKEVYKDVRLVGAPPTAIGKFGGDTDNWVWPRHTGDFSLFRIYTDPEGNPAEFSEDNIPLKPRHYLPVNLSGVEKGDFTMVYGFPGRTSEYLHHKAVDYVINKANPAKIKMRKTSLNIIDAAMAVDDATRIKYAAKQSRVSNAYKKWIGQNLGLESYNAVEKKIEFENDFQLIIEENAELNAKYDHLLLDIDEAISNGLDVSFAREMFIEFYYYGPEIFRFAGGFSTFFNTYDELKADTEKMGKQLALLSKKTDSFFKNYNKNVDRDIFNALWPLYIEENPKSFSVKIPSIYKSGEQLPTSEKLDDLFYGKSFFSNKEELKNLLKNPKKLFKKLKKDQVFLASSAFYENYFKIIKPVFDENSKRINVLMRTYTRLQKELILNSEFWPDANSTLRLTYGKAEGSTPRDGMEYKYRTTLDGIIEKNNTGETDFVIPDRLRELWKAKDYGQYTDHGELPVCFLGSNHTTGGNSGSPALDAEGNLIGLNFDRTWESTMSDIMFDPEICRNIMVDIRYVLFIIDIYADAGYLVDEMTLINK